MRAPLRERLTPPATLAQGRFQLTIVKAAERRGPRFSATSYLILPRDTCAELIAMYVLCCLLAMSRLDRMSCSDRQCGTGVICEEQTAKRIDMENKNNNEDGCNEDH